MAVNYMNSCTVLLSAAILILATILMIYVTIGLCMVYNVWKYKKYRQEVLRSLTEADKRDAQDNSIL